VQLPVLIRFQDLLQRRVIEVNESFRHAIEEFGYQNVYQGVYPIKVNQLHEVVLEILEAGEPYNFGLECGSKAELFACLPHLERDNMLLIVNGYKDLTMLRTILMGQQLGKTIVPVLEKYKVTAIFSGHDHTFQHHEQNGVHYIVTGGGGAPLNKVDQPHAFTKKALSTEHFVTIDVKGNTAMLRAIGLDGTTLHEFQLK
jgi:arginine decarboxylase-like protein